MSPTQHVIELNGKRYDALTGKLLATTPPSRHPAKVAGSAIKRASMDGFARVKSSALIGNPLPVHRIEKSKTLMRKIVKKPMPPKQATHKTSEAKGTPHRIEPSASAVSGPKLAHAKAIPKSALIKRFGNTAPGGIVEPQPVPAPHQTSRLQAVATAKTVATNPLASRLATANSHEQPKAKRPRPHIRLAKRLKISPRTLSAASLLLAGLLIGGFFVYQNIPNLNMRLASARAGVHGTLPSYQPAGFTLNGGISYKPGQIIVNYKSNSDNRSFKITQSTSSWNSETLLENYEALKDNSSHLAVPTKGKTVYIYNGSNATWVDGGVWYRIEGNSQLNSDQLLSLANSL